MNLTLEQRDRLRAVLPAYEQKATGRKRADLVKVFKTILWVLQSGAGFTGAGFTGVWTCWEDIDKHKYPSYQTCHRYFQEWVRDGVFEKALEALIKEGEAQGVVKLHESFVDGSFVRAKKGAMK